MKILINIFVFFIHAIILMFVTAWNVLALLKEIFDGDDGDSIGLGCHYTTDEKIDLVKRAGTQYIDDRDVAVHERNNRH